MLCLNHCCICIVAWSCITTHHTLSPTAERQVPVSAERISLLCTLSRCCATVALLCALSRCRHRCIAMPLRILSLLPPLHFCCVHPFSLLPLLHCCAPFLSLAAATAAFLRCTLSHTAATAVHCCAPSLAAATAALLCTLSRIAVPVSALASLIDVAAFAKVTAFATVSCQQCFHHPLCTSAACR
jgi:hypothetical protein